MGAGSIVIFVACGAIRRIRRAGPGDGLTVGGMARLAGECYAMVTGIIPRGMHEGDGGCPCRGGMADITLLSSDKVAGILPGGRCTVVASRT